MDEHIADGRLQADTVHRYYYYLADNQKRHVGLLLAGIALLAGVLLIADIPSWGSAIAFFVVTLLSVAFLYRRDAEHGALASLVSIQYASGSRVGGVAERQTNPGTGERVAGQTQHYRQCCRSVTASC